MAWDKRQADIAEGKISPAKELSEDQMMEMIRKVKQDAGQV